MSVSKFLAVDLGAESGRAFVGVLNDRNIHLEEIHRFPNIPIVVSGHLHWDAVALFKEIKKSLRLAVQKGHEDIESLGIDTWGVDFGLVKREDGAVDSPFTYRDSRTNGMMEKVFERISGEEIYARTGIQLMQINSLYQLYSVKQQSGGRVDGFDKLLFMPDLMNYFLTGNKFSEYTIASTSQMLSASSKEWDKEIFSKLDLPIDIMAQVVQPGTVIGTPLPSIMKESGMKRRINVVAVGSHDTASAIAAVPAIEGHWAYLSSGTWSLIGIEAEQPIINELSRSSNFTNEGGVGGKITFLQNIMGLWLLQEVRRSWEKKGDQYSYDELAAMARDTKEFKCLVNPSDNSFLNPPNMQVAIVDFCKKTNQPCPETKGEIVRCIFESLAFSYRSALKKIRQITSRPVEKLHIVGGGCQNEMLNQFTADSTDIPVVAGPVEATALGNILVQAMSSGKVNSLEEGRKIGGKSFPLKKYFPQQSEKWGEVYERIPFSF
ncbi:MAG TPA: rhamnulokinase family protein [Candidatus Acidoferrales bacterium]|nr:rhamnulokinase family protein [Candidatus Acidoferrales bacterium]